MRRISIYSFCLLLTTFLIFAAGCAKTPEVVVQPEPAQKPAQIAPEPVEQQAQPEMVAQPKPTEQLIIGMDGAEMVLIPAGEFLMGGPEGEGDNDEHPQHTVFVDSFYMDKYEVTNAQYKQFMDATGHNAPKFWDDEEYDQPNYPVGAVNWHDAKAYCEWAGKRLPTEAEWEKAARGGLVGKTYPWGDSITHDDANYEGTGGKDRWSETSPVGSFAPNGYGLYDMAGNVWEWCADWYDADYYAKSLEQNPAGPSSGSRRVLSGGSWCDDAHYLRAAERGDLNSTHADSNNGFRGVVAQD